MERSPWSGKISAARDWTAPGQARCRFNCMCSVFVFVLLKCSPERRSCPLSCERSQPLSFLGLSPEQTATTQGTWASPRGVGQSPAGHGASRSWGWCSELVSRGRVLPGASSTWRPVRTHTGMIPVAPLPALKADGERECKTIAFYGYGIYDGVVRCELLNKTFTAL